MSVIVLVSGCLQDILPDKHSAILIEDFESPKELAAYLKYLDQNDEEYNKYLRWKDTGVTNKFLRDEMEQRTWSITETWRAGRTNFIEDFECFVCERVHENLKLVERGKPEVKYIANISHLECPKPKSFFSESQNWEFHYEHEKDVAETLRYFSDINYKYTPGDFYAKLSEIQYKKKRW